MAVSLAVVVKGPEGLVLAADSRLTLLATYPDGQHVHATFDSATKLLGFADAPWVGAVTYGEAVFPRSLRAAHSFLPEYEARVAAERENMGRVEAFAARLSEFYMEQWKAEQPAEWTGTDMLFLVAGFDDGAAYGRVFQFGVPSAPEPTEMNPDTDSAPQFGITWGGQRDVVDRIVQGYDSRLIGILEEELGLEESAVERVRAAFRAVQMPIPLQALPLQDCVDLAVFLMRTTMSYQQLSVQLRGCGGPIDVATITRREGLSYVQRKTIQGEPVRSGT